MNRMQFIYLFSCLWIVLCGNRVIAQSSSSNYKLFVSESPKGGGLSTSSHYHLTQIMGQELIGTSSSSQTKMQLGVIPYAKSILAVINPYITDTVRQTDLTWMLPRSGTFSAGTQGWIIETEGNGTIYHCMDGDRFCNIRLKVDTYGKAVIGTNHTNVVDQIDSRFLDISSDKIIPDYLLMDVVFEPAYLTAGHNYHQMRGRITASISVNNTNYPDMMEVSLEPESPGGLLTRNTGVTIGFQLTPVTQDADKLRNVAVKYEGNTEGEVALGGVYLASGKVKTMNPKLLIGVIITLGILLIPFAFGYQVSTVEVSNCLWNNDFNEPNLAGWSTSFTLTKTTVFQTTCDGRNVVCLRAGYTSSGQAYDAKLISIDTATTAIVLVDSNSTLININQSLNLDYMACDAIKVKVFIRGDPTVGDSTITGQFSCTLKSALSFGETSSLIYEKALLKSPSSVIGCMNSWHILSFTFPTHLQSDWWQVRNIELNYQAAPNQPNPTGVLIDRIEVYAIQVGDGKPPKESL